jgi:type I restriction enzyme S subunit
MKSKIEWIKTSIGDVTSVVTKGTTPSTYGFKFEKKGINFIRAEGISKEGSIDSNTFLRISEECHIKLIRSALEENDILFSIAGMALGKTGIVKKEFLPANTNQAVAIIRPIESKINPKFLQYQLINPIFYKKVNRISGQSAQPNINLTQLKTLEVKLPPLPTQQKIASILGAYDDLIENNLKRIQLLEEAAQNLYKEWFVNFRFPNHENHPFDKETGLPEGWSKIKLGDMCDLIHGYSFKANEFSNSKEKYLVIRMGNFKENGGLQLNKNVRYLKDKGALKDKYILEADDLVMVLSDVTRDGRIIGNVGFIPNDNRIYLLNQRVAKIKIKDDLKYIIYSDLNSIKFKDFCKPRANGATVLNLKTKDVLDYEVLIPDENLKQYYSNIVSKYIKDVENLIKQNQQLQEARDLLLPRLMNRTIEIKG